TNQKSIKSDLQVSGIRRAGSYRESSCWIRVHGAIRVKHLMPLGVGYLGGVSGAGRQQLPKQRQARHVQASWKVPVAKHGQTIKSTRIVIGTIKTTTTHEDRAFSNVRFVNLVPESLIACIFILCQPIGITFPG